MKPTLIARSRSSRIDGFTLVELLVSMALLTFLMLVLAGFTEAASRAWREGQSRTETFQSARNSLEIVARELTPAVVDTRMQFVVAPSDLLVQAKAEHIPAKTPVLLWMAPLGEKGDLYCVGYYLYRDDARKFYQLKRIFIPPPTTSKPSPYFPQMVNGTKAIDKAMRTSPTDAEWFTTSWDKNAFDDQSTSNTQAVVSAAADGVVAFWVQCYDVLGNPIPLVANSDVHPRSKLTYELYYNSAAYFQVATSTPFIAKTSKKPAVSFQYLAASDQAMKANRLPAAVDLTVVTIDSRVLARGLVIPPQTEIFDGNGAVDVDASVHAYQKLLEGNGIRNARTFSTRVKLVNGS